MELHLISWSNSTIGSQTGCSFQGTHPQLFVMQWHSSPCSRKNKPPQLPIRHALIGPYNTLLLYLGIRQWQVAAAMCTQSTYLALWQRAMCMYQGSLRSEHRKAVDETIGNNTAWGLQIHFVQLLHGMHRPTLHYILLRQTSSELHGWQGRLNNRWHSIHLVP